MWVACLRAQLTPSSRMPLYPTARCAASVIPVHVLAGRTADLGPGDAVSGVFEPSASQAGRSADSAHYVRLCQKLAYRLAITLWTMTHARLSCQRHSSTDVTALQITKVVIPPPKEGKARDYAFVHFADSSVVAKLIEDCERGEKPQLEGAPLEV